jgi:hypothetical protein
MSTIKPTVIKAARSDSAEQGQFNQDVKSALDRLLGNAAGRPQALLTRALTGQDLIDLGLVTVADLRRLR